MTVQVATYHHRAKNEICSHMDACEASKPGSLDVTRVTMSGFPSGLVKVTKMSNCPGLEGAHGSLVSTVYQPEGGMKGET